MNGIKKRLQAIRNELLDANIGSDDDDYDRLVKLENIDEALYQTLLMIHQNYRAEFQAMRSGNLRTLSKIIDSHIDTIDFFEDYKEILQELDSAKSRTRLNIFLNPKNVLIVLFGLAVFVIVIWKVFSLDSEAAKNVIEFFKTLSVFGT